MRRLLILATLALAACGGGGTSAVTPPISIPSTQPASHAIKLRAGFSTTGASTTALGRQVLSARGPLALGLTGSLVPVVGYAVFPSGVKPVGYSENASAIAYLTDSTNDLPATGPAASWANTGVQLTMVPFPNWTSPGPVQQSDGSWSEMLTTPQTVNLVPGNTQTGVATLTATTSVAGQSYSTNINVNVYNGLQLSLDGNGAPMVKFVNGLATPQTSNNTADILLEQNSNGVSYIVCQFGCAFVKNANFLTLTSLPSIPVGSASIDGVTLYNESSLASVLVIRNGDGTYTKWNPSGMNSNGNGINNGDISDIDGTYRQCTAAGICDI